MILYYKISMAYGQKSFLMVIEVYLRDKVFLKFKDNFNFSDFLVFVEAVTFSKLFWTWSARLTIIEFKSKCVISKPLNLS
jgi:hypothetical protein